MKSILVNSIGKGKRIVKEKLELKIYQVEIICIQQQIVTRKFLQKMTERIRAKERLN